MNIEERRFYEQNGRIVFKTYSELSSLIISTLIIFFGLFVCWKMFIETLNFYGINTYLSLLMALGLSALLYHYWFVWNKIFLADKNLGTYKIKTRCFGDFFAIEGKLSDLDCIQVSYLKKIDDEESSFPKQDAVEIKLLRNDGAKLIKYQTSDEAEKIQIVEFLKSSLNLLVKYDK